MIVSALASFARRQHGLVTRAQALNAVSEGQLKRALRVRQLEPVRRGVYRMAGAPETWWQHLLAVCLAAGPDTYGSFRAAAAVYRLEGFAPDVLEITRFGGRSALIEGVTTHETAVFAPTHVAIVDSIPVTSAARTLCDLTAVAPAWKVERAVDECLRRKLVELGALQAVAEKLEGSGRLKCRVMRAILELRTPGYHPGESAPEQRIARLLVRAGLPRPVHQYPIRVGGRTLRADLAYPDARLLIEYDGWDFHRVRSAFDRDHQRRNQLRLAGYTVLVFTARSTDHDIVESVVAARRLRAFAS